MKALILMTRVPYPGQTKTRLMPVLNPVECEMLHWAFLKDYFDCFKKMDSDVHVFVAYAPENFSRSFTDSLPIGVKFFPQKGCDLGSRMWHSFQEIFNKGYTRVVLVGCDIPHISLSTYRRAFKVLEHTDIVVCPTEDGGYCLIGLKCNQEDLLINKQVWESQTPLEQTYALASKLNLSIVSLDKYRDLDVIEDLIALNNQYLDQNLSYDHVPSATLNLINALILDKGIS